MHHLEADNIERGEELLLAAVAQAKAEGDAYALVRANYNLGDLYFWCQVWDAAREHFEQVMELTDAQLEEFDDLFDDERRDTRRYLEELARPVDPERRAELWRAIHQVGNSDDGGD